MNHPMTRTFVAGLLGVAMLGAGAQTQLTPPAERISDRAIQADHRAYEALQGRIQALNDAGRPVRDYHLSKAQCWLDVSLHEYTRNDRSAFPQEALAQSEQLIALMEKAASPRPLDGPWDTPLVNGAPRVRPDLWARAAALRQHGGFACAAQRTACAEVELVHAGNELAQQQWRHAKPYVQIAEDQLGEAEQAAAACLPPAAPVVAPAPAPAPSPAPAPVQAAQPAPVAQPVSLRVQVVFNFDRHTLDQVRPDSRRELDALVQQVRQGLQVQAIRLVGHADRLNHTGRADYNLRLSERRAATVRDWLVRQGLPASVITAEHRGDTEQVAACADTPSQDGPLQACLLPNRRVEVELTGTR